MKVTVVFRVEVPGTKRFYPKGSQKAEDYPHGVLVIEDEIRKALNTLARFGDVTTENIDSVE